MKTARFHLLMMLVLAALMHQVTSPVQAEQDGFDLRLVETHHVAQLNSNQPYVAGYDVLMPDLHTMKPISAATITVSFESSDPSYFPPESWLGGGLFIQDQDSRFGFVDYGFYIILVLDHSGNLFLDVGLHQTRESTAPVQGPTAQLIYAYTWQIPRADLSVPFTLGASWDSEGFLHYSVLASGTNVTLPPVNVAALPNCENIHRQFWSGNWMPGVFPFSHFVYYFQFGVISSEAIANNYWSVELSNPRLLKKPEGEWRRVETAWSTQGDVCYLDWDWMWGGMPYHGVSAHYYQNPLENSNQVIFFYNGKTLPLGTVLWKQQDAELHYAASSRAPSNQTFPDENEHCLSTETLLMMGLVTAGVVLEGLRRKTTRKHIVTRKPFKE